MEQAAALSLTQTENVRTHIQRHPQPEKNTARGKYKQVSRTQYSVIQKTQQTESKSTKHKMRLGGHQTNTFHAKEFAHAKTLWSMNVQSATPK